ncbi:epoxyqueuosine reductase QueH [bacterium]|nr:epoxyqueuosine reductase QueH [bacterium]
MSNKENMLLHACCAPCTTVPLQRLSEQYMVDVFFYNPNIYPEAEYEFRRQEIIRLGERWNFNVFVGPYDTNEWFNRIHGFENEPERGARCEICIRMRLEKTAQLARERGYKIFTSTLSLSPLKSVKMIHRLGEDIEKETGVSFIRSDFKKKDGFRQSVVISNQEKLYRQDYCGCVYSRNK